MESRRTYLESTRSPAGVDKEPIRSPQGLWKKTTWFIVDSYHHINNHPTTDYICCKWCNPAPLIGSAPNLVIVENDVNENPHYKCAFNSQACEQLNIWLGWFQLVGVGHCFAWQVTRPPRVVTIYLCRPLLHMSEQNISST